MLDMAGMVGIMVIPTGNLSQSFRDLSERHDVVEPSKRPTLALLLGHTQHAQIILRVVDVFGLRDLFTRLERAVFRVYNCDTTTIPPTKKCEV